MTKGLPITMAPSIFKSSTMSLNNSTETSSTAYVSSTISYESSPELGNAPRKPQRLKSGSLETFGTSPEAAYPPATAVSENQRSTKSNKASPSSALSSIIDVGNEEDNGEEKWVALNDSKPTTAKRRVRRIVRSHSDSDMSEASSIDSSSGMIVKGSRKDEIQARNNDRQAQQEERKQQQSKDEPDDRLVVDEDDDLVDTDKEMPMSEEVELALREKRREIRRKFQLSGGRRVKKDGILSPPKCDEDEKYRGAEDETKSISTRPRRRANSHDGRCPRRKKHDKADADSSSSRMVRSSSADRPRRKKKSGTSSGFNMLLSDSRKDVSLNVMPLRVSPTTGSFRDHPGFTTSSRRSLLSQGEEIRKEIDAFMITMKNHQGSPSRTNIPQIDSDVFAVSPSSSSFEGLLKNHQIPEIPSRRDMMMLGRAKPRRVQSDRFLCNANTSDFAPRMSSRCLNDSGHDDDDNAPSKPSNALSKFMAEESSKKVRKSKKGSSRSLDAPRRRKSRKNLLVTKDYRNVFE